jgi:transcriptional regulator with XRE-family HTH domain
MLNNTVSTLNAINKTIRNKNNRKLRFVFVPFCFMFVSLWQIYKFQHMNINELTASKIKELRKKAGISAEAVAADIAISKTAYSQLENGKVEITLTRLESLSKVLKMPIGAFLPISSGSQTIQIANGEKAQNIQHQSNSNDPQLITVIQNSIEALQQSLNLIKQKG